MTRIDRRLFVAAVTAKRRAVRALRRNDRVHNWIESYYNVLDFQDITQHELMLADSPRVDHYYRGIQDNIGPDMTVIDLGTGTGILACFAAARNPKRVYAIDHGDIIGIAERVAEANGLADRIEFVAKKSTEFTPPAPVDVILHEQIGNTVFNEQIIDNLIDLRNRALKPGGRVLPNPIRMFVEPAELKTDYRVPFIWQFDLHGVDFSGLSDLRAGRQTEVVLPLYQHHYQRLLTRPEPIFVADFETIEFSDMPTTLEATRTIEHDGTLDGFCLYFEAVFDEGNVLSNSPMCAPTCWQTPMLRIESRPVRAGDVVTVRLSVPDFANTDRWVWRYEVASTSATTRRSG